MTKNAHSLGFRENKHNRKRKEREQENGNAAASGFNFLCASSSLHWKCLFIVQHGQNISPFEIFRTFSFNS